MTIDRFRGYRIDRRNGRIVAGFQDLGLQELSVGDVVIETSYSSVNYKDALAATGAGKILRRFPLNGGLDVAGVVLRSGDPRYSPGERVVVTGCGLGEDHDGGYCEYVRVRGDWVVPLPDGLSLHESMCLGTAGFTAALAIERLERNRQHPDMGPVVVTGASGGVGSFAVNMLAGLGFEVVAVTGKPETTGEYLEALGATRILDRSDIDFGSRPLESIKWAGAIDNVGGEMLTWLTRTVGWWGNIACIGLVGSPALETTVMPLILRGVSLLGVNSMATPREERLAVWERMATSLKPAAFQKICTRTIDFDELPSVFDEFLRGEVIGRTVVQIGPDPDRD